MIILFDLSSTKHAKLSPQSDQFKKFLMAQLLIILQLGTRLEVIKAKNPIYYNSIKHSSPFLTTVYFGI